MLKRIFIKINFATTKIESKDKKIKTRNFFMFKYNTPLLILSFLLVSIFVTSELRRKLCLKSEQRKTRVYSFRKKQHVAKISKMRNNAKKIEDDEVRIQRCDENYSQIDLMHQFIFQKLEVKIILNL